MAQYVRTMLPQGNAQWPETLGNHGPHGTAAERLSGRFNRQEDLAIPRGFRTPVFQVAQDGLPDCLRERVALRSAALGARDPDQILFPIQIFQLQCPDFTGAQAINSQEQRNSSGGQGRCGSKEGAGA